MVKLVNFETRQRKQQRAKKMKTSQNKIQNVVLTWSKIIKIKTKMFKNILQKIK